MKLYRLVVIGGYAGVERAVWAERMEVDNETYKFYQNGVCIARYPTGRTVITNIETKEAYETRKEEESTKANTLQPSTNKK